LTTSIFWPRQTFSDAAIGLRRRANHPSLNRGENSALGNHWLINSPYFLKRLITFWGRALKHTNFHIETTQLATGFDAPPDARFYRNYAKRSFDLALAIALTPIVAPIIALLWLVAKMDGGSGFFGHTRIGKDSKGFRCWKIRTMVVNAPAKLAVYLENNPEAAKEWKRDHKLRCDPRITPVGDFLRRTSLDELPQLWNVFKGEMSFVGPRPIVQEELSRYGAASRNYLSVRPGITGLWQVSGRNDISYDERVDLDVAYIQNVSFLGDAKLILATANTVLKRTGK